MFKSSQMPFWSIVIFTTLALTATLVMFAIGFDKGIEVLDESLWIDLLREPNTLMPTADHQLWGRLLAPFPWNIVEVRWIGAAVVVSSALVLTVSVLRWMGPQAIGPSDGIVPYAFLFSLTLFGALFYYTYLRPTPCYTTTQVTMPCLFVAAMLWRQRLVRPASRVLALIGMAVCCTMSFLAKPTSPVLLFAMVLAFEFLSDRTLKQILETLAGLAAVVAALLALAALIGVDLKAMFQLFGVVATVSHSPLKLLAFDFVQGIKIVPFAVLNALALVFFSRLGGGKDRFGTVLLIGLSVFALELLVRDAWRGRYLLTTLIAARNMGPMLQAIVLAMVIEHFAPLLSARWRPLQKFFPPRPVSPGDRKLVTLVLVLYGACLSGLFGTNTGLWTYSVLNMGPLFLLTAILILYRRRQGAVGDWTLAGLLVPVYLLFFPPLYVNLLSHPARVAPAIEATVRLDHPAVLRGLWVTPELARLQQTIERQMRSIDFDAEADRVYLGDHMPILMLFVGGKSLGSSWTMERDTGKGLWIDVGRWNCAVIRLGMRHPVRHIVGIDLGKVDRQTLDCLAKYGPVPPITEDRAVGNITVITPYGAPVR